MSLLEDAFADTACLIEEYGLNDLLGRYGLDELDMVRLLSVAHGDLGRAADIGHGLLLGYAMAEAKLYERKTA